MKENVVTTIDAVGYLAVWGTIGVAAFSSFVVVAFRTGLVYTARRRDGTLKERVPIQGALAMMIIPAALLVLQLLANYTGLARRRIDPGFGGLYVLNFLHFLILFTYDTLVIDGLVLGLWHPAWLKVPDKMGRQSMARHIRTSLPVGVVLGALMALVTTGVSYLAFVRASPAR
jgi:hypothetical protein